MKKYFILTAVIFSVLVFSYCSGPKKAAAAPVPKSTYMGEMASVVSANCTPCHIPANGGRKKAYDNYTNLKDDIDEIIQRISSNPTDRGFMPFKKTERLPDSTIAKFKKWKEDGLLEK
jgi:mono/diheme cytochrome c family protein